MAYMVCVSNPDRSKRVSLLKRRPLSTLFNEYWGFSLWHSVNHSPPSNVEVKNEWGCTSSTPPVCMHGVNMENFTFMTTYVMG
jgi:hypothetical protein